MLHLAAKIRSWSPWARAAAVLLGIGIGIGGLRASQVDGNGWGVVVAALAAAVLLGLFGGMPQSRAPSPPLPRSTPRWVRRLALAGLLLALAFEVPALVAFHDGRPGPGWIFHTLAVLVLIAGFAPWRGAGEDAAGGAEDPTAAGWRRYALLGAVVALAAVPRLHLLDSVPYGVWFDEAQNGLEATRILDEDGYRPVFVGGASQMPALLFYYIAPFVAMLGPKILAVRLAITILAILAVAVVWLLADELFGPRVATIAAVLLAFCRWHIGFSRLGMAIVLPSLVLPLVFWLFLRSQNRRSPRDAALAGVSLGLGLQTYYAVIVAPVLLLLWFVHRIASGRWRSFAAPALLALTLFGAAVSYAPVFQYARQHPAEFAQRMSTVSILPASSLQGLVQALRDEQARGELLETLRSNTRAHLRMFHLEGDRNGRHNLPGAPMLDPVTGLFLAVGLLWCLALIARPDFAFLLLWFAAMLSAGILSLAFEAPQAARTAGITSVVSIIAALPLSQATRALHLPRLRGVAGALIPAGLAALLLVTVAVTNWRTYFDRHLWDPSSWVAFSTPETKIAEVVRNEGEAATVYVPPTLAGGPTQRFLIGRAPELRPFDAATNLPLEWQDRPAIVFFSGTESATLDRVRAFYPNAKLEPFGAPRRDGSQEAPVLWIARIAAEDLASFGAWTARYLSGEGEAGEQALASTSWSWSDAPVAPPFEVRMRGYLRVPRGGEHRLAFRGDGAGAVRINGERVLEPPVRSATEVFLARGTHRVAVDLVVPRGAAAGALEWAPPGADQTGAIAPQHLYSPSLPAGGLLGSYHAGTDWQGEPVIERVDSTISFYFHELPLPRPFSIRWRGKIYAPLAGTYRFDTSSIDGSFVAIDGRELAADRNRQQTRSDPVELTPGWHSIEVRYYAVDNYSQVYLYWTPPGAARSLVPSSALAPPGPSGEIVLEDEPPPAADRLLESAAQAPPPVEETTSVLPAGALTATPFRETGIGGATRLAAGDGGLYLLDFPAREVSFLALEPSGSEGARIRILEAPVDLADPADLTVATASGHVLVLDSAGAIHSWLSSGEFERSLDLRALGVYNPRGLQVSTAGDIYIADTGLGRLLVCDWEGNLLASLGTRGNGPGEFGEPMFAALNERQLVLSDRANRVVHNLELSGRAVGAWKPPEDWRGPFDVQVAIDEQGGVWAVGGEPGSLWRLAGSGGAMKRVPTSPAADWVDLAIGRDGALLLLERATGRVHRVAAAELTGDGS